MGYLNVFGRFVAERLKTDTRFQAIFTTGQLAQLLSEVAGVTVDVAAIRRLLEERFGGALIALQRGVEEIGAQQEQIEEQVEKGFASVHDHFDELFSRFATNQGVPRATLVALLARMGEANVPEDQAEAVLEAKVAEYLALREQLAAFAFAYPTPPPCARRCQCCFRRAT